MPVDTKCQEYSSNIEKWERLRDCYSGRDALMSRGRYLDPLPGEATVSPTNHELSTGLETITQNQSRSEYLKRPSYFNAMKRTVNGLVGLVYQKAAVIENAGDIVEKTIDDISPKGLMTFDQFGQKILSEVIHIGRVGALVDVSSGEDKRPFAVIYLAEDIINWRYGVDGRKQKLEMLVLREHYKTPGKDKFEYDLSIRYRVCQLVDGVYIQNVWTKSNDGYVEGPEIIPTRSGEPLPFIPFGVVGPSGISLDVEESMMIDLADVSIAHYKNSADYEYGLHLVALPTPWVSGMKGNGKDPLRIGPSTVWELSDAGKAGMLEFGGQGLGAIALAMVEKKAQMAILGARLLEGATMIDKTATEVFINHIADHATLRTATQATEQFLTEIASWIDWWLSLPTTLAKPEDSKVNIELNKQFFNLRATPQQVQQSLAQLQAGKISFPTFYNGLQTGDWTREDVDAEQEKKDIQADQEEEAKRKAEELKNNPQPPVPPVNPPTNHPIPPGASDRAPISTKVQ